MAAQTSLVLLRKGSEIPASKFRLKAGPFRLSAFQLGQGKRLLGQARTSLANYFLTPTSLPSPEWRLFERQPPAAQIVATHAPDPLFCWVLEPAGQPFLFNFAQFF